MSTNGEEQRLPSLWLVLAMPVSLVLTVFALGFGLLVALGLDEGGEATPPTTETQPGGNEVGAAAFASQGCGGCHTLSAADASGTVGPSLDETALTAEEIADVVANGRPGTAMAGYSGTLDEEEIASLAAYISESAASP